MREMCLASKLLFSYYRLLARRRKGVGRDFDGKLEAGQERRPLGSGPRGIGSCGQEYQEAEA